VISRLGQGFCLACLAPKLYGLGFLIDSEHIELLDAVTSVPYSRKGLGYTIGRGLDAVLPFTCYSYWFSCYFDQRGKLMKALGKVY
jgi:hypothetical protein